MSRGRQGSDWSLLATAALLLLVATAPVATAKTGPAAGAAGSGSPLLAAVDVDLGAGQDLDVNADIAGVELALEAPRSWTYLDDLARFADDAKWRLEVDAQGLSSGCLESSVRLKTRVWGYKHFRGGNKAVKISMVPYAARDCEPSRTAGPMRGLLLTTDPLGYVDGPNLYQFALNNPVNFSDPMGLYVGETDPAKIQAQQLEAQRTAQAQDAERWRQFGEEVSLEQDLFDSHVRYNGLDFWSAEEQKQYAYQYFQFRRGMNNDDASAFSGYLAGPVECDPTQPHCLVDWEVLSTGVTVMEAGVGISLAVFDPALLLGGGGGASFAIPAKNPALLNRMGAYRAWQARAGIQGKPTLAQFNRFAAAHRPTSLGTTLYGPRSTFAAWSQRAASTHGNSLLSTQNAYLYQLFGKNGEFLKWGISQDPFSRYPASWMRTRSMEIVAKGPRWQILRRERYHVETNPGPLNLEPWAGDLVP